MSTQPPDTTTRSTPATGPASAAPAGLFEAFVEPFYLSMMRLNVLRAEPALLDRAIRAASVLSAADVHDLLHGTWRDQVLGAWYALAHPGIADVRAAVLDALATRSSGDLTSPSLATSAVVLAGTDAVPAIAAHLERTGERDRGDIDRGICTAAAEFAYGAVRSRRWAPSPEARADFGALLDVAARFVAPAAQWTLPGVTP